jgi:NO-binding membrane sensor protein with MHYT domain
MLHQSHNALLVLLSVIVAALAGFAALDLSARVAAASGWARAQWVAARAVAMGVGIWSMHFVAMLALRIGVPVTYNVLLLVLSLVIAISASAITFTDAATTRTSARRLGLASLAMGPAIAGMHYTGMAAMRMLARAMSGDLKAESTEGKGSTLALFLRRAPAERADLLPHA